MPRPKKEGLDYFPLDTTFDQKMNAFLSIHGKDGFTWIIQLWREAYKSSIGVVKLRGIFGEVLAKNSWTTTENQEIMLKSALELDLLKETDEGITSNGIQKRIASVSNDREKALLRYFKGKEKKSKEKKSRVKDFGHTSEKYSWKIRCSTFEDYQKWEQEEYEKIISDSAWIQGRIEFHGKLNILLSIKKAHIDYWSTKEGWKKIKSRKGESIDWRATWANALTMKSNQVWLKDGESNVSTDPSHRVMN